MPENEIRDLLYLDFDKAASIWSQFEGGLREKVSVTDDATKGQKAGVSFGIPKVAEANLGLDYSGKRSTLETKILHHDILNRIDSGLTESGLVVDLAKTVSPIETDPQTIRNAIGLFPYLKATGSSVVEDYRRILSISEKYNDIVGFIAECGMQSIKQSPEFVELQRKIDAMKADIKAVKDGNQKAKKTQELKRIESTIQAMSQSQISGVDKWLLNGIKLWITTFMPTRINFRVYPFSTCPSFQVLCNLKRDCFVDQDPEHLLYGYGNRPNVPLTVFGLLTSIPMPKEAASFDPMAEFEGTPNESSEQIAFEKGFRGIFGAMDNIEALMRFSRYPNVTVHPIAVYRSFVPMSS